MSVPILDAVRSPAASVLAAAERLRAGGLVIFPTETLYGLAALATCPAALARLVALKGREAGKALPLIAASPSQAADIAELAGAMAALAARFWPGPLTMALPPRRELPREVVDASGTVAIRVSSHPVACALAGAAGAPITATSANLAGRPPVARVSELDGALVAGVDAVLDAGACPGGAPSTIVAVASGRVVVLRAGAVPAAALADVLGYAPERLAR